MTLKLNHSRAEALLNVLEIVIAENPADASKKLVILMMIKVYKKVRAKLEARLPRGYSVTVTPEEALAYYAYFQSNPLTPTMIYENNFINTHLNEINRKLI